MTLTMAKFNPQAYDPTDDSSDHSVVQSEFDPWTWGVVLVQERYQDDQERDRVTCLSGSLKRTSRKSSFAPGMDARLKGILIRAYLAGQSVTHVTVDGDGDVISHESNDPYQLAKVREWQGYLDAAKERQSKKEANAKRKKAKDDEPAEESGDELKVGDPYTVTYRKKERTGTIVELDHDYVLVEIELAKGGTKEIKVDR